MHLGWSLYERWVHQSLAVGFRLELTQIHLTPFPQDAQDLFACGVQMAGYTRMRRQDGESHGEVMLCSALEFYL